MYSLCFQSFGTNSIGAKKEKTLYKTIRIQVFVFQKIDKIEAFH